MNKIISHQIAFRVSENLYKEFRKNHLDFLKQTEYDQLNNIKDFVVFLIKEWEKELLQQNRLQQADEEVITYVNRKGRREDPIVEDTITKINYNFRESVKKSWDNIIYTLIKEEDFINSKKYSNSYFLHLLFEYYKDNASYFIEKFAKTTLKEVLLKLSDKVTFQFISKFTIKEFSGDIEKIENTPKGLVIKVKRDDL